MSRSSARWVRIKQAAEYYQVSLNLIRARIAHEQLEATAEAGAGQVNGGLREHSRLEEYARGG